MLNQPFYTEPLDLSFGTDPSGSSIVSYEDTVLWLIANFQYVVAAIAFNSGPPFRKHFYTNIPFTVMLLAITAFDLALLFIRGTHYLDSPEVFALRDFMTEDPAVTAAAKAAAEAAAGERLLRLLANTTANATATTADPFVPTDYYNYRWWMFLAICLNVSITYLFEKFAVAAIERSHSERQKVNQAKAFQNKIRASEQAYNNK